MATAACVAAFALPASAAALPGPQGRLTQLDQIPGNAATDGCVTESGTGGACEDGTGLVNAFDIGVAPDGEDVYGAGTGVSSIARTASDGKLQQTGCAGTGACQPPFVAPLDNARAVAVSPDGEHVYAVSFQDAVVALKRKANGTLIPLGDPVPDGGIGGGRANDCVAHAPAGPTTDCINGKALDDPTDVAVAPDGENVYVSSSSSNAVAVFDRATSGPLAGKLTQPSDITGCISTDGSSEDGVNTCGNALGTGAFNDPRGIEFDSSGSDVYVASEAGNALHVLDRAATGALTDVQCLNVGGTDECGSAVGVLAVSDVAVAPDGLHVYATNSTQHALAIFARSGTDGTLSQPGAVKCVAATGSPAGCGAANTNLRGLSQAESVTVSPDNKTVYMTGATSGTVLTMSRNISTGVPEQLGGTAGCTADDNSVVPNTTCENGKGLVGASDVAVAPDNRHVYTTSLTSQGVAAFARQLPPQCVGGQLGGTRGPGSHTLSLTCPDPNGDAITQYFVNDPPHGTLGTPSTAGGTVEYTPDAGYDGPDSFSLNAQDDAETGQAVTVLLDVDTIAPVATVTGGPEGTTDTATPSFAFAANEPATFECRVDDQGFGPCSGPGDSHTSGPLADGSHSFEVRATDGVGNQGTAARSFTVQTPGGGDQPDADPPETTLKKPKVKGDDVKIRFSSDEPGATFRCKRDKKPFKPCTSPKTYRNLDEGKHRVAVAATDPAGNPDPSPAKRRFKIEG